MSAFRFLVQTSNLESDESLQDFLRWKCPGVTIFADTSDKEQERHVTWYQCRSGEVQNVVGLHPTRSSNAPEEDQKAALLDEFPHFHPNVLKLLEKAEEVKCWKLAYYEPFRSWTYRNVALIGDAAHPMLPFGGQAANQAIEDAGAIGRLMKDVHQASEVESRLQLFEKVRIRRASMIQILSSTRVGREKTVQHKLWNYAEPGATSVPQTFGDRIEQAFSFDVLGACDRILQEPI